VKYGFIKQHRIEFHVFLMCRVLRVSRSGYYEWLRRPESSRHREDRRLSQAIMAIHRRSRATYGSRRIKAELTEQGEHVSRGRISRLLKEQGLEVKSRRKFKATTNSKHKLPVAPNLLDRRFTVDQPNAVWVSDISYIWTDEGWLYLAGIVDLYSRMVVGWSLNRRITKQLTLDALNQALERRRPQPGLLHHSDRGSQYAAGDYQTLLEGYGITCSMSRKGDCWDNAPMESFFATLKTELIFPERFTTREEAKRKIFEYIEVFYNRQRRHSTIGYQSPADYEAKQEKVV